MRRMMALALVAGSIALAVVIGQRMSADAMAVVVGVVVGVAASIPTSLLVVAATRGRREPAPLAGPDPRPPAVAPQIYLVSPPAPPAGQAPPWLQNGGAILPQLAPPQDAFFAADTRRRFRVVGEDEHWLDDDD